MISTMFSGAPERNAAAAVHSGMLQGCLYFRCTTCSCQTSFPGCDFLNLELECGMLVAAIQTNMKVKGGENKCPISKM